MDTANRRPQLPALSYLDVDKAKRDEESQQNRPSGASQTINSAPITSPTYYPSGPPPPYSHPPPQHTNSWPSARTTVQTPPDSRRTSGEDHDYLKKASRTSLPSISEALGESTYPSSTAAVQPPPQSAAPSSPPLSARRPYIMEPPQSQPSYATTPSAQFSSFRQDSAGPQSYPPVDAPKPTYVPAQEARSAPLHLQTSQPAPNTQQPASYSYTQTTSPRCEQQHSQSAGSMGPPPSFPYGYTPYPPKYAQPSSTSHSSNPIYQPSVRYAPPPSSTWKCGTASPRFSSDDHSSAQTYSESVKRQLDLFDLEAALNEIASTSGIVSDFSRRYGDRMHQTARPGPSLSNLPSMVEVEDMINKSRIQLDALTKIREVILTQQAAYEQQLADQRQQQPTYSEPHSHAAEHLQIGDEGKGGFAGGDTKKRRGRAAPPGRCHSCNRAETPEWRRGPDGARTLCNACGLHYAKLTRKQTGANKAANVGSSNLRPKES